MQLKTYTINGDKNCVISNIVYFFFLEKIRPRNKNTFSTMKNAVIAANVISDEFKPDGAYPISIISGNPKILA